MNHNVLVIYVHSILASDGIVMTCECSKLRRSDLLDLFFLERCPSLLYAEFDTLERLSNTHARYQGYKFY